MRIALVLAAALVIAAGTALAEEFPKDTVNAFKVGVTTMADVQGAPGEAGYSDENDDGRSTILYAYDGPPPARGKPAKKIVVGFVFDAKGVLQATRFYEGPAKSKEKTEPWPPAFDPFNAAAVQAVDWNTVAAHPVWRAAQKAGPGAQQAAIFPYRAVRTIRVDFDGVPSSLALREAKDGSGRRYIEVGAAVTKPTACADVRRRLVAAYGEPRSTREWATGGTGQGALTSSHQEAQWTAGPTTVTQDCSNMTRGDHTVYGVEVILEPSLGAQPLAPRFALSCPQLRPPSRDEAGGDAALVIIDPRGPYVRAEGGAVIGIANISASAISFRLEGGDQVDIDRAAGAYTVSAGGKPLRQGACQVTSLSG